MIVNVDILQDGSYIMPNSVCFLVAILEDDGTYDGFITYDGYVESWYDMELMLIKAVNLETMENVTKEEFEKVARAKIEHENRWAERKKERDRQKELHKECMMDMEAVDRILNRGDE